MRLIFLFLLSGFCSAAAFAGGSHADIGPDCYLREGGFEVEGGCVLEVKQEPEVLKFIFDWENGLTTILKRSKSQTTLNGSVARSEFIQEDEAGTFLGNCYRTLNAESLFCASVLALY